MSDFNMANRQVCDVDIKFLATKEPFLFFDTANTTTAGLSSDSVYAMAKGTRRIAFANPLEGTMTIEAQVYPFRLFALFSDGTIDSSAAVAVHKEITCETAGELALTAGDGETIQAGTVFAYPKGSYGVAADKIEGTFASNKFTATEASKIAVGSAYEVGYIVTKTGVEKIAFNNKKLPADYYITMTTLDKDELGTYTPFVMTAYKASIQRSFDLSFSSEGDPASVTLTFDLMEDKDGNILDMVEYTEAE